MNTPPIPSIPSDGGTSLLSFLSVALPVLVLFGMVFWAWPHIVRALTSARAARPTPPVEVDEVADTTAPPVVEHRSADLPAGIDLSIYGDRAG